MEIIEIIKAIILGIVQGISEWLPISSTGHLILVEEFIKLNIYKDTFTNQEFVDMFMVVIQLGSILAVLTLYFHKLNPFSKRKSIHERKETINLWGLVLVACIPAGIIGLLFDDYIDELLYNPLVVSIMLIVYGLIFIIIEKKNKKEVIRTLSDITIKSALIIGIFQVLALIPGTSRSGATIVGALLIGTNRSVAAEFSFFLAIPVMFGASLLKLLKLKIVLDMFGIIVLVIAMLVAFIVSVIVIKYFMNYIKKKDFIIFGYYRIILGIIILGYFLI